MAKNPKYYEHKSKGLCVICSNPSIPGGTRCAHHTEKMRQYLKTAKAKNKREVIEFLGGKCACCGEKRLPFLQIDHVNNDGKKWRDTDNGHNILIAIKMGRVTASDLQVLCANCHQSKTLLGYCIHKAPK